MKYEYFSPSSISTFLSCPKQYFFSKTLNKFKSSFIMDISITIHKLLSICNTKEQIEQYLLSDVLILQELNNVFLKYSGKQDLTISESLGIAKKLLEYSLDNKIYEYRKEEKIKGELDYGNKKVPIYGIADAISDIHVVDWKLHSKRPREANPMYVYQIGIYGIMKGIKETRLVHIFIEKGNIIIIEDNHTITNEMENQIRQDIYYMSEMVEHDCFPMNPMYKYCTKNYCNYWEECQRKNLC